MTAFYPAAAVLCVLAIALVTLPAWWPGRAGKRSTTTVVDELAGQLRQLKQLHDAGTLSDEHYAQSREGVERKLLAAITEPVPQASGEPRPSASLVAGTIAFVAVVAVGGYSWFGAHNQSANAIAAGEASANDPASASATAEAPHAVTNEQIMAMIDRLAARLKTSPDDAEGWQMLARSYVAVGKHVESIEAFRQAVRLRPADAGLLADYADALAVTHDRRIDGEPLELVDRALKIDPANAKAHALAGTVAFDRQDYKAALDHWQKVAEVEPATSALAQQAQQGIAEARQLAGMPPAPGASAPGVAQTARISGTVSLADALRDKASPDDTLFVFARRVEGSRMPLSILRKQVRDLPLQFTLDDTLAMSPDAKLSSVARVIVGARVSKSGNAVAQSGDLQGFAAETAVGSTGVKVVIGETVGK
jgi:cytochrome c-type biogenesis protein CcmH